jgi:transcriptional regulator
MTTLYIPPAFRIDDPQVLLDFMRENAFGTLVSSGEAGLHVSHVPFIAEIEDGRMRLLSHVARNNPQWEALERAEHVLAIFQGPHAYVSPTWYVTHPSVPTWNYTVVHAHGKARLTDEAELHDLVTRLSAIYEAGSAKPWRLSEQPAAYVSAMLANIVGIEIAVERVEGKFKLSQNRPVEVPHVAAALEARGETAVAALMRNPPPAAGAKG